MCQVFFYFFLIKMYYHHLWIKLKSIVPYGRGWVTLGLNLPHIGTSESGKLSRESDISLSVYFLLCGCNHKSESTQFHLTFPSEVQFWGSCNASMMISLSVIYLLYLTPKYTKDCLYKSSVFFKKDEIILPLFHGPSSRQPPIIYKALYIQVKHYFNFFCPYISCDNLTWHSNYWFLSVKYKKSNSNTKKLLDFVIISS